LALLDNGKGNFLKTRNHIEGDKINSLLNRIRVSIKEILQLNLAIWVFHKTSLAQTTVVSPNAVIEFFVLLLE
jgi:hypothetical protein